MPGRRRPDDFSLLRKSQAPRFTGPGAEAKTGSGSAETENGRGGGLAVTADPCAVQVCLRGGPMRNISSEEEAVFRRAGRRGEDRFGFCRDGERPRGACRCRRPVCSAGLPSGRSDAEYILGRRSCFSPGRAQSRGLSDRIEEREATARTSRFFVSVPAADAACGARPGRAALRKSADA